MFFDICHWPTTNGFSLLLDPTFVISAGQFLKIIKFQSSAVKIIVVGKHIAILLEQLRNRPTGNTKYKKYEK
jgi:hypothetical protein